MNTKVILFSVLVFFTALVSSEPTQQLPTKGTGPWIVNVYYNDYKQVQQYASINEPWMIHKNEKYFTVSVENLHKYQELFSFGFKVEVNLKMMESRKQSLNKIKAALLDKSTPQVSGLSDRPCIRTVEETYQTMDDLIASYPNLASNIKIGESWEKATPGGKPGYDLRVLKITNVNTVTTKPKVFFVSSIHARELAPAELNTRLAEYLLHNYGTDADATWLIDNREIHLMLQGNPDGRKIAEAIDINKRKNENNNFCSGGNKGVDMNRNFIWQWGAGQCTLGCSSTNVCSDTYRGTSAQSEHENTAIDTHLKTLFADNRGPNLNDAAPDSTPGVYIDIHSYSDLVLWPYGFSDPSFVQLAPNDSQLQTLGRKFAWYNQYTPMPSNDLYGADGAADDNAYGQLGVASYTFELGNTGFRPQCNYFESTILPDNLKALIYAIKVADAPYIKASGPDIENLDVSTSQDFIFPGDLVNISGVATDNHFYNDRSANPPVPPHTLPPPEPTQSIAKVELFIDESPWDVGATPILLNATDGNFNAVTENFSGQIDTTGMSLGQHVVYLQTTDSSGVTGVPYAKFFTIVDAADLGTLSGTITDATTNLPIDAVILSYNGLQASSDASGHYSFSSLASTANLSVAKQGYAPQTIDNVSIVASQTTTQNIQLQPICALLDENVEAYNVIADAQSAGWSHGFASGTDDWAVALTGGYLAPHAFSTSDPGVTTDKWLISPAMDLTADSILEFWHKFGFEGNSPYYDGGVLEIATNTAFNNWVDLGSLATVGGYNVTLNSGNPLGAVAAWGGSQSTFQKVEVALSSFAGTTAKIRWRMAADSTVGGTAPWIIDDIQVLDPSTCSAVNPDVLFLNGFE